MCLLTVHASDCLYINVSSRALELRGLRLAGPAPRRAARPGARGVGRRGRTGLVRVKFGPKDEVVNYIISVEEKCHVGDVDSRFGFGFNCCLG